MDKLYYIKPIGFFFFLFSFSMYSQGGGCPNVYAGEDVAVNCSDPCTTLTANYLETGETTAYAVSSIPYAPPFPFTGGANSTNITSDDKWSSIIDLGFDFCFFGDTYNKALINSNGALTFSIAGEIANGKYSPNTGSGYSIGINNDRTIPGNTGSATDARAVLGIFGVLQDTDPTTSFQDWSINYEVIGNYPCRMLVLNYYKLGLYACGTDVGEQTYQTILYETTNVIEVYVQDRTPCSTWQNGRGLIGIQNGDATLAYSPPGRNTGSWSAQNEAWRFTPNGDSNVEVTWYANGIEVGSGPSIDVCVDEITTFIVKAEYTSCTGASIIDEDTVTVSVETTTPPDNLFEMHGGDFTVFDLTVNDARVLEGLDPLDYLVSYYELEADAQAGINAIANPTAYQIIDDQIIYVRVESISGNCIAISSFNISILVISIDSFEFEDLNMFPNPTSGNVTIQSSQLVSETTISLYDILGKMVLVKNVIPHNGTVSLDISSFENGVYFVKISCLPSGTAMEGKEVVRKLIKG